MTPKLDPIDMRYAYAPDTSPADGLRIMVFDKARALQLVLTSVKSIDADPNGDYTVTIRARAVGDLDTDPALEPTPDPVPVPEPVPTPDPVPEPTPTPTPVPEPNPVPTPVPTPPITGATNVFGPAELLTALKNASAGDTIVAKSGAYGVFGLSGIDRGGRVTVVCEDGVHFERLLISTSKNLTFDNPNAYPFKTAPLPNSAIIQADAASAGIEITRARVRSGIDADDYLNWDAARWNARQTRGITLEGVGCSISDCDLAALRIGAIIGGAGSSLLRNKLRGFSEDGMRVRGNGDSWTIVGNDIANAISVSTAHCDGIQFWSLLPGQAAGTGLLTGLLVEDNLLREWIGPAGNALRAKMQGLGAHDGKYDAPAFRRNEVWCSSKWGLHVAGGQAITAEDNRLYDINRKVGDTANLGLSNIALTHGNTANRFTMGYPMGQGDAVANYAIAPQMSLVD